MKPALLAAARILSGSKRDASKRSACLQYSFGGTLRAGEGSPQRSRHSFGWPGAGLIMPQLRSPQPVTEEIPQWMNSPRHAVGYHWASGCALRAQTSSSSSGARPRFLMKACWNATSSETSAPESDGTATAYVTDTDAFATSLKSYLYTLIPAILEITAQAQGMSYDEFMTEAVKQFGSEEAVYDAVLEQVDFDAILQTGDLPTKDVPTVGTYTIDGDRVTVTLEGDVTEMTLSGDTLTTSEDGVEMVYHREK